MSPFDGIDPNLGLRPDLRTAFERQHSASRRQPAPDLAARRAALSKLRELIRTEGAAIAAAISEDFGGRSPAETELLEVVPAHNAIRHAYRHLALWMRDEPRPVDLAFQPARAWVRHEPLGVVGIIAPWNYPLLLTLAPLVDALAAGNRALLKPSELTPSFSALLAKLIAARFDPAEVHVVTGGVEVAKAFSSLPFDHLIFTGSTHVGRQVMAAAAANLTPVTLELGGKSPAVVCADYSIDKAARSLAFGKFVNAGQTCIAPDYVLAPADKAEALAEAVLGHVRRSYPTIAANSDYSSLITERHHARLVQALDEARAAGADIRKADAGEAQAGRKLAPTVVLNAPADGVLLREEIFGPILPIVGYRDLDEALAFIAERERPLALYAFTHDRRSQDRILNGAISGGVTLNGTLLHIAQDELPFGGVGPSGIGAYHGREGFRRLSHARSVYKVGPINTFERLGPPWGKLAAATAAFLSRR
jgi:coniferyl-aldehyde dehydrogenase